jgi:pimeloyl-ACP methyl ester carboxylesterase
MASRFARASLLGSLLVVGVAFLAKAADDDFAGLVDIGGGRKLFMECRGTGSPTVVLIAGGWEAGWLWTYALAPDDPVHALPYDAFGVGQGDPRKRDTAVFPQVARFTRVCLYDRANTTVGEDVELERGGIISTDVAQPHSLADDVADLRTLLATAGETGPFVLAAHSYGGLVTELYARQYPDDVAGEVLVDVTSVYVRETFTPTQYQDLLDYTSKPTREGQEAMELDGGITAILAAPAARQMPVVLLSMDKPPKDTLPSFQDELTEAHNRLARYLGARWITETASGHHIHVEQPQLVTDAIREVVEAVRAGVKRLAP